MKLGALPRTSLGWSTPELAVGASHGVLCVAGRAIAAEPPVQRAVFGWRLGQKHEQLVGLLPGLVCHGRVV